jgi:hypothetical protein
MLQLKKISKNINSGKLNTNNFKFNFQSLYLLPVNLRQNSK